MEALARLFAGDLTEAATVERLKRAGFNCSAFQGDNIQNTHCYRHLALYAVFPNQQEPHAALIEEAPTFAMTKFSTGALNDICLYRSSADLR